MNSRVPKQKMPSVRKSATPRMGLYGALFLFVTVAFYMLYVKCAQHILLAVGATLVLYATSGGELVGSMLAGALLALAVYFFMGRRSAEGFENASDEGEEATEEGTEEATEEEEPAPTPKPKPTAAKKAAKKRAPPPDNGDRAEMFELGKGYKMPAGEGEDKDYHLDAGTTFMNAYKSLKPEQIAAMTKDTQELMETQKQLMGTLKTLQPLVTDGKQMMEMFQSYFGSGKPSLN
jgi:hypothetical protein